MACNNGQVENAEVQKLKYGNRSMEVSHLSMSSQTSALLTHDCVAKRVTVSKRCES